MSMPVPNLDDRDFQGIVDEAKRLIPKYCPEWTNHNVSDPGIALIEIFAWMTELTLFRINQIPDRLYTAFLNLVGFQPFNAKPATVDLTFWLAAPEGEYRIDAGTEATTQPSAAIEPVAFMTDVDLDIAQPDLEYCITGPKDGPYDDRWDDLYDEHTTIKTFTPELQPEDAIYFGFAGPLSRNVIQFEIDAPDGQGLGIDPLNPPLRWEAMTEAGWEPARMQSDETGGLNRPGNVALIIPAGHERSTLGLFESHWVRARLMEPDGNPQYRASPEIRSMAVVGLGGTVPAKQGRVHESESIGVSDGTPGQSFKVSATPVLERRRGENMRVISENGVTDWEEVDDFGKSTDSSLHYTWDSNDGTIRFGPLIRHPAAGGSQENGARDLQYGKVPEKGTEILVTAYRTGGGGIGNLPKGTITSLTSAITFIDRVENLDPSVGGLDAESPANAKVRGPLALRTGERAVTSGDYERLAVEATRDIARARCLLPEDPEKPIRLLLVPQLAGAHREIVIDDMAVSKATVRQVIADLEPRRLIGSTVEVVAGTPYYKGVTVVARVSAASRRDPNLVRQRAT